MSDHSEAEVEGEVEVEAPEPAVSQGTRVHRISDSFVSMVSDSLVRLGQGEELWWDYSFAPAPEAGGSVIVVMVWVASGMPDGFINHVAYWNSVGHTQEKIDASVRQIIESLLNARSEMLTGQAPPNGTAGLFLPPHV